MALVKCKECQADVSSEAFKCPHCGATLKVAKRGFFGKLFKWSFILFNILMVLWLFSAFSGAGNAMNNSTNEAEQIGTAIGATMATGMIVTFWAIGDIILGLFVFFTKPKQQ
jgi:hypothetical protein